jgi:hypothetical protein
MHLMFTKRTKGGISTMGINLRKAQFFTQFTFPGLYNPIRAMRDEEGDLAIPAWMCDTTHPVSMGYGPDDIVPCADKADHIVTYRIFYPHRDEADAYAECTEKVCWRCFADMRDYQTEHGNEMEIVHIVDTASLRDFPTKPVNLRKYYSHGRPVRIA